jgi:hypothetical protein
MPVTTREERRQQRKYERQAAQRKAARSATVRRNAVLIGGVALVIAIAIAVIILAGRRGSSDQAVTGPGTHFDDPVTASGGLYQHIPSTQPIQYDHYPPNHGNHYDTPRPWGSYDTPVPDAFFVHNLEHGGIVVLYNCPNGCADVATQLKNLPSTLPKDPRFGEVKVVVSPYDKSDHLISLVAWDWEQDLDSYDFDAIKAFYQAHVDKGPEQIP